MPRTVAHLFLEFCVGAGIQQQPRALCATFPRGTHQRCVSVLRKMRPSPAPHTASQKYPSRNTRYNDARYLLTREHCKGGVLCIPFTTQKYETTVHFIRISFESRQECNLDKQWLTRTLPLTSLLAPASSSSRTQSA